MDSRIILVVDDDPDIRDVIAETLADEGFSVLTFGDGEAAVTMALENPPGLIVLDLMMPKMSGWQVINALQATPRGASIPIILVSASRDLDRAAHKSKVAAYLAKPFDLDSLVRVVEQHISAANE